MPSKTVRNEIVDNPTSTDLFRGKGHERTALSLAVAIKKFDGNDRAIGLDGPWGSGKSSIVEIAASHLRKIDAKDDVSHHFFTFDIWKSQGTGFRRSFLEHFVAWAKEEFPKDAKKFREIEDDIRGKRREVSTNNQPVLGWFGIAFLFVLPLLPIYYFWAKSVFDRLKSVDKPSVSEYLFSGPGVAFLFFALGVVGATVKKRYFDGRKDIDLKMALSSILLISSKQHQDHTSIQKIREIDPNDYEFHETLRSLLSTAQGDRRRVVVVLDNIDRLPLKEIQEYWALARSIFSGPHRSERPNKSTKITAIIPYDRVLIEKSLGGERPTNEDVKNALTRLSTRELFSKTFDEILTVAPPVMSNAREFFATKLEEALPKQILADEVYRTYRIFMEILREDRGLTTPRQVVSFVNDVSGIYALHNGQFSITTVAAYLAHQDQIAASPASLNDPKFLDPKVVSLAGDDDLARNLAAIVFNVDSEMAFEVLLDNDLAASIIQVSHEGLLRLSRSAGFDLRVDDVVQSNAEHWSSTNDLGRAITNFAQVLPSYQGSAKQRVVAALCKSFDELGSFEISEESYREYLPLFDISDRKQQEKLIISFLQKGFQRASSPGPDGFDAGRSFAKFLGVSFNHLHTLGLEDVFKEELAKYSPNSIPDFLYGLALDIADHGLNFKDLGRIQIDIAEGDEYYRTISEDSPGDTLIAMKQFSMRSILQPSDWVDVANACGNRCSAGKYSEQVVGELLELMCYARSKAGDQRDEVAVSQVIQSGTFFRNLGDGQSDDSSRAIALAFFLVLDSKLEQQLSTPVKVNPNGQRLQDSSEEFSAFAELVSGTSNLTDDQARLVGQQAHDAGTMINRWTDFGQNHDGHLGCQKVVKTYYAETEYPAISAYGINSYFTYLRDLLGREGFKKLIVRYEPMVTDKSIAAITIDKLKIGFLSETHLVSDGNWRRLHKAVDAQLQRVSKEQWKKSFDEYDHLVRILVEKVSSSGCTLDSSLVREPISQFMLDVLSGKIVPTMPEATIDLSLNAIQESYHGDIFRTIREKISDVGTEQLALASAIFPKSLAKVISEGDRITAQEKDSIIRHTLCPALEGNILSILNVYVGLGYRRVSELKKGANESTRKLLDASLESFSRKSDDSEWTARVTEVIYGKRRAKGLLGIWLGSNNAED